MQNKTTVLLRTAALALIAGCGTIGAASAQVTDVAQPAPDEVADPTAKAHSRVDQLLQTEAFRQGRDEQQPGVRDEVRVIEGRVDPVERMRYSRH